MIYLIEIYVEKNVQPLEFKWSGESIEEKIRDIIVYGYTYYVGGLYVVIPPHRIHEVRFFEEDNANT